MENSAEPDSARKIKAFWTRTDHRNTEQVKRRQRSIQTNLIRIDKNSLTGIFGGTRGETYHTTLTSCGCYDFTKRRRPCKHMYRLAEELNQTVIQPTEVLSSSKEKVADVPSPLGKAALSPSRSLTFDSNIQSTIAGSIFDLEPKDSKIEPIASGASVVKNSPRTPEATNARPAVQADEVKSLHKVEDRGKRKSFAGSTLTFLKSVCATILFVTLAIGGCLADSKKSSPGCHSGNRSSSGRQASRTPTRGATSPRPQYVDTRIESPKPTPRFNVPENSIAAGITPLQPIPEKSYLKQKEQIPSKTTSDKVALKPMPHSIASLDLTTALKNKEVDAAIFFPKAGLKKPMTSPPDKYATFSSAGIYPATKQPVEAAVASESTNVAARAWSGQCVGILDGDTISVMRDGKAVKVRLYGIDSPERKQDFGQKARDFIGEHAFRKNVTVIPVDMDRYGRIVAQITIDQDEAEYTEIAHVEVNGVNLSRALVTSGFAWVYDQYCSTPECDEWRALQNRAKQEKRGLWSRSDAIAPWEWRRRQRRETYGAQAAARYHGNVYSLIFHRPSCMHFNCQSCIKIFDERNKAIQAGYRPCDICRP